MENSNNKSQPKYWMSLEQWRQDPEFLKMAENEFLSSPLQSEEGKSAWARREFLTLMGASLALTTFGCVRRPAQKIIPYAKRPPEVIPGISDHYTSSFTDGAEGIGILVTTKEGRPIKIEGNTEHPFNKGGMSARAHAHILKLYDPDRWTGPKRNLLNEAKTNRETINVTWEKLDEAVSAQLKKGSVAVLMSSQLSPSTNALIGEFVSTFGGKTYTYDDIGYEAVREGQKASYGQEIVPSFAIDKAKVIVAVNNDFLGTWLTPVHYQKGFSQGRKPTQEMNKLISFESLMSMTGMNADERHRIKPSQTLDLLLGLAREIVVVKRQSRFAGDAILQRILSSYGDVESQLHLPAGTLSRVADELWRARGKSLVLAGGLTADTSDAVAIQVAMNLLNSALENEGQTVLAQPLLGGQGSSKDVAALIAALNAGAVKTVVIHGPNPLYSLPESSGLRQALVKAEMVIYSGDRNDETGRMCDYIACDNNPLENWSDMEVVQGLYAIQQPTIRPLYNTRAFQDSLVNWIKASGKGSARVKASENGFDYMKSYWQEVIYDRNKGKSFANKGFEDFWAELLQAGAFDASAKTVAARSFNSSAVSLLKKTTSSAPWEFALYSTVGLGDGYLANVSWLQEFPDPVTKICWDNYLCMAPADAKELKVKEGQMIELTVSGQTLKVPAHVQPGQAPGTLGLAVGYGRTGAGKVADGVGVNAFPLAQWNNGQRVTAGLPAEIKVLSNHYKLANTQGHNSMEGRQIVVEEALEQFMKKPGGNIHRHKMFSMWSDHKYNGNKWGMVIDLNSCTGCGSCVIACQSENNIPTVGRRNVINGREMHWIRIDRY